MYLLVYHKEDNDGLFSMGLMYNYLHYTVGLSPNEIILFGANYQEMSEVDIDKWIKKFKCVIMTDISLPFEKMKKLYEHYGSMFIWVDHHAPIINETNEKGLGCILGSRRTDRSAILNMWDYLYNPIPQPFKSKVPNSKEPELLKILSAYDSFTFDQWGYEKEFVTDVNTAVTNRYMLNPDDIIMFLEIYKYNVNKLDYSEDELIEELRKSGHEYNQITLQKQYDTVDEYGADFMVGDRTACAIFESSGKGSQWFGKVKDKYQCGIIFKHQKNGRWTISLYNTDYKDETFHCGEYLKEHYGGGGHQGASGCQISEEQFIEILKSKKL